MHRLRLFKIVKHKTLAVGDESVSKEDRSYIASLDEAKAKLSAITDEQVDGEEYFTQDFVPFSQQLKETNKILVQESNVAQQRVSIEQQPLNTSLDFERFIEKNEGETPVCVDLSLTYNYRSQANILAASFDVISNNHDVVRRPLLAKCQNITLADMVTVTDPNAFSQEEKESRKEQLAYYEKLGALSFLNEERKHKVEFLAKAKAKIENSLEDEQEIASLTTMKPIVVHVANVAMEAKFVVDTILDIQKLDRQASVAVLYRSRSAASKIEEALLLAELPYRVVGSVSFFERKEIQDALAYMRLRVNPDDNLALRRVINVPPRRFGAKKLEYLETLARQEKCSLFQALLNNSDNDRLYGRCKVREFVEDIITLNAAPLKDAAVDFELILAKSGYENWLNTQGENERLDNLAVLKQNIVDYVNNQGDFVNLADFLYSVMLLTDADEVDSSRKEVQLMTIHTSKGLEFDYVFVIGVNESIFPSRQALTSNSLEEERRLMYVAMTRARKQLFISEAGGFIYLYQPSNMLSGNNTSLQLEREPSRFLRELNTEHIAELGGEILKKRELEKNKDKLNRSSDNFTDAYQRSSSKVSLSQEQSKAKGFKYPVGSVVQHPVFGTGEVVACIEDKGEYEIFFSQIKRKRNILATVANRNLELIKLPEGCEVEQSQESVEQSAFNNTARNNATHDSLNSQQHANSQVSNVVHSTKQPNADVDSASITDSQNQYQFKDLPEGAPYFDDFFDDNTDYFCLDEPSGSKNY